MDGNDWALSPSLLSTLGPQVRNFMRASLVSVCVCVRGRVIMYEWNNHFDRSWSTHCLKVIFNVFLCVNLFYLPFVNYIWKPCHVFLRFVIVTVCDGTSLSIKTLLSGMWCEILGWAWCPWRKKFCDKMWGWKMGWVCRKIDRFEGPSSLIAVNKYKVNFRNNIKYRIEIRGRIWLMHGRRFNDLYVHHNHAFAGYWCLGC